MKKITHMAHIILIVAAVLCGIYGLIILLGPLFIFPIPRGSKIDDRYYTYYENIIGIYYISLEHSIGLFNHGDWGYLKDVDKDSFKVLSFSWAMDKNHVWHCDDIVEEADVETFYVKESGLAADRNHIYVRGKEGKWVPSKSGIDPATAEYFISKEDYISEEWIRDKDNVYYHEKKMNVDRNTFSKVADEYADEYYVDKDFLYATKYNEKLPGRREFVCIDSIQSPLEILSADGTYIRNGQNIIYGYSIILKDVDVQRFEMVKYRKCVINDMLFYNGRPFLKDSLNVSKAKFYDYAIVTDGENVFWGHQRLDDIDAATFKEITNDTFEDKDYIYTIKDFSKRRNDNYPFNKRKKTIKGEQVETGEKVKGILFPLFLTLLFGICGMRIWRL